MTSDVSCWFVGSLRRSAPACNGPGHWHVTVLMNFGAHILRETRGTTPCACSVRHIANFAIFEEFRKHGDTGNGTPVRGSNLISIFLVARVVRSTSISTLNSTRTLCKKSAPNLNFETSCGRSIVHLVLGFIL